MNTTGGVQRVVRCAMAISAGLGLLVVVLLWAGNTARAAWEGPATQPRAAGIAAPVDFCSGVSQITTTECAALVALYTSTNGPGWTDSSGWLATTTPCLDWHGVSCDQQNNVTGLDLQGNNLSGEMPAEIDGLAQLTSLNLNDNQLTGTIPYSLGQLVNLRLLDLGHNDLSGVLPDSLGSLTSLRYLWLKSCRFSGPIPASLEKLTNLRELELSYNQLSGPIPAELDKLTGLEILYLKENLLSGPIPASLGSLDKLRELDLFGNQLIGPIPDELGQLGSLEYLNLGQNPFNSRIPAALGNLTALRELHLGSNTIDNGITGPIPPELGKITSTLEVLDLFASYGLTGTLPAELGQLSALREMNLEEVAFVGGPIPASFGNLANLEVLNLGEMELEGPIPAALSNLDKLVLLDLSRNALTGPIPADLGKLTSTLEVLDLSQNLLTGTIPAEIGELTNLTRLCLHANALSGEIPPSLADLENPNTSDKGWHTCNLGGNEGITALDYNSLYASDARLLAFLDGKDPTWDETQTVAPTNLHVAGLDAGSLDLAWTPIRYTQDGGYYQVFTATQPAGPYYPAGETLTKTANLMRLEGFLPGASYYFRLRTFTPAHQSGPRGNIWVGQQNDLWSEFTPPLGLTFEQVQPQITSSLTITDASNTAVTMVAPAGSVTQTVTLGFATREAITNTTGFSFASLSFDLTAFENGQPLPQFTFAEPLTVTIRYTDQDVAGLNEQSLLLFYWDEVQDAWVDAASTCSPQSTYQRNPQENWLALPICHLSTFGLFSLDGPPVYLPVVVNQALAVR